MRYDNNRRTIAVKMIARLLYFEGNGKILTLKIRISKGLALWRTTLQSGV